MQYRNRKDHGLQYEHAQHGMRIEQLTHHGMEHRNGKCRSAHLLPVGLQVRQLCLDQLHNHPCIQREIKYILIQILQEVKHMVYKIHVDCSIRAS